MSENIVRFEATKTPKGCVAIASWPSGRFQEKRYLGGQERAETCAVRWITDQIESLREKCEVERSEMPKVYVNGKQILLVGQSRTWSKSIKFSCDVAKFLVERGDGCVEDLIRKSKAFKDWVKSQKA
jgi:hypothetical protein